MQTYVMYICFICYVQLCHNFVLVKIKCSVPEILLHQVFGILYSFLDILTYFSKQFFFNFSHFSNLAKYPTEKLLDGSFRCF